MHVLFLHPSYPNQFINIAHYLARQPDWQVTCVYAVDTTHLRLPFRHLNYRVVPGPMPRIFRNPNGFQGLLDHMDALHNALQSAPSVQPDLVVGHMWYGTMLYLRNLYRCPFVGYYEFLPPPFWTDGLILRKEFPPTIELRKFNAIMHTLVYLHLHTVEAAYTPTHYQLSTAPEELRHKIRVIFDGVDTALFQKRTLPRPFTFHGVTVPPDAKIVTYVSPGLESSRGFDIFMKAAKRIAAAVPNAHFFIAGNPQTNYGHELHHIGNQTFKEYVLKQDDYDLTNFHFLHFIPLEDLATLFNLSDLHVYLTVPYVLSWSLVQAMASGCTIISSATPPVQEAIDHGKQGLLVDFLDYDALAGHAIDVLSDPMAFQHLGEGARARVMERYANEVCLPQQESFLREVLQAGVKW